MYLPAFHSISHNLHSNFTPLGLKHPADYASLHVLDAIAGAVVQRLVVERWREVSVEKQRVVHVADPNHVRKLQKRDPLDAGCPLRKWFRRFEPVVPGHLNINERF